MVKELDVNQLLDRNQVQINQEKLLNDIKGKILLVTGAGGSIGSELVRQLSNYQPKKIILLGHGENSIYHIFEEIKTVYPSIEYQPVIADIQDKALIETLFQQIRPDIVYHAAAHKHVTLMEYNAISAFKNNVLGTLNIAKAVNKVGIKKMVMISTDKAVNPTSVMGATKRLAELLVTATANQSESIFCCVRFGNVLGSRGSVIPLFKKQILNGGPVTVTDKSMTRYFMTIPEASTLAIYAGSFGKTGEVFILEMGDPINIYELAKKMINLMSDQPIEIVETGKRPGEKIYEELISRAEDGHQHLEGKLYIGNVKRVDFQTMIHNIRTLSELDESTLKVALLKMANEY